MREIPPTPPKSAWTNGQSGRKASRNGMDPAGRLKEMLVCYDGCSYELWK
jgi:hypothetical protein